MIYRILQNILTLYSDDTSLLNSNICISRDNLTVINDELNKVYTWLCTNRLSLNIKKTKFMILRNKNKKSFIWSQILQLIIL